MVILLIILITLIPVIIISPLEVRLVVLHHNQNDEAYIQLSFLWRLIKLKLSIKSLEIGINKIGGLFHLSGSVSNNSKKEVEKSHISFENLLNTIKSINLEFGIAMIEIGKKIMPPIKEITFSLKARIGTADAASTGIICGLLRSIHGMVGGILTRKIPTKIKNFSMDITPVFNSKVLSISVDCIFKFTIGHIIITTLKFVWLVLLFKLKGGEIYGRSSNRSLDENSYGKY